MRRFVHFWASPKGGDPAADKEKKRQTVLTMADLCNQYLADAEAGRLLTRRKIAKKASTLVSDRGRLARHIKPLLGHLPVAAVRREDVEEMMHAIAAGTTAATAKTRPRGLSVVRGGRGVASRTVGLLGAIFTYAVRKGLRADNPAHGVMRFGDQRRERRLTDEEYIVLGKGLRQAKAEGMWEPAIEATRFMAISGWRRGEVLGLKWSEVDLTRRTARLADTKTGFSMRALSEDACSIIREQARSGDLVFPARTGAQMIGYRKHWLRIAKLGELPSDVSPHVLRHSFASLAGDLGYPEGVIAGLVGHKLHSITSRYVHCADAVLLAAADIVASKTLTMMTPENEPMMADRRSAASVA